MTKSGGCDIALMRLTASWKVPVTFVFGGLLNPMWLSLIWTNVKSWPAEPDGLSAAKDFGPENAATHGIDNAGANPAHALEESASVDAVLKLIVDDFVVHKILCCGVVDVCL